MRCKLFPLFVIVLVCAISAAAQKVIETESVVQIRGNTAIVSLVVESSEQKNARATLELIDKAEAVLSSVSTDKSLVSGRNVCEIALPLDEKLLAAQADLPWYRLRYRVGDAAGIVSFSEVVRDLFELRVAALDQVVSGSTYRVRVRALNPFSFVPQAGVALRIKLDLDLRGNEKKQLDLDGAGITNADGFAIVDFTIPPETQLSDDGEITVNGTRNGVTREASEELHALGDDVQFLMLTDKPIYQPDQVINIRGILLKGSDERTVLSSTRVEFRIVDEDDTVLYRENKMSSEFGIAAAEWRVPSNAKLGSYWLQVRNADGDQISGRRIRISRYELPNFTVTAKPAKPYYVVGDSTADVEVRADYLFGKPVTKGHVRVVEEKGREWNWKDQKYDIEEGQVKEGETDADGKFHAIVDLKEKQDDLKDDDWQRFRDINFAAYFTDPTTNRTEQRRFDIRITHEPIHVYFVAAERDNGPGLPIRGYVSTFYADGTPAECGVEIKAHLEDEGKFKSVAHLRTNSFGAALVSIPRPNIGDADDNLDFKVFARASDGRRGTSRTETLDFDEDDEGIQITSDLAIYKPGEMIHASIASTKQTGIVFVDVTSGVSALDSHVVSLTGGKAEIDIPYSDRFKGALGVVAFTEKEGKKEGIMHGETGVIFPSAAGVRVNADFDKAVYKPSDEAKVKFDVTNASGNSLASALGIVVVDQAVEERAQTDADFGGVWRDYAGYLGYGDSFAGVNLKDLQDLDLSKPISPEMQVVAKIILRDRGFAPDLFHSKDFESSASDVFSEAVRKQFAPVDRSLRGAYQLRDYLHPVDDADLRNILGSEGVDFDQMRDPWDMSYRTVFNIVRSDDVFTVISAGPDKKFDTDDDFNAYSTSFAYFVPVGKKVDLAVEHYRSRTGEPPRDLKTVLREMNVDRLLDRFGHPYKLVLDPDGRYLKLTLRSSGKNGKFDKKNYGDDFDIWTSRVDVFQRTDDQIRKITNSLKPVPMNESEFRASLKAAGLDLDKVVDGYGRAVLVKATQRSRYWDKISFETVETFGKEDRTERRVITPVTQEVMQFDVVSPGKDGKADNYDDYVLTEVVFVLREEPRDPPKNALPTQPVVYYSGSLGSISGTVTDAAGGIVAGATVTATGSSSGVAHTASSSANGTYLIIGLTPDIYTLKVDAPNFKHAVINSLKINGSETLTKNVVLEVGAVSEMVTVTSETSQTVETSNSELSSTVNTFQLRELPINGRNISQLAKLRPGLVNVVTKSGTSEENLWADSTPRVREYFPETLYWQPEVITGADGRASLSFKIADSITTWKMYAVASTKDGKIGVTQKNITAFQPFFVDLDPPKFLTEGDEIFLPSQVRNYTEKDQKVDVTIDRADWFSMLGPEKQQVNVKAGDSQNAVFGFKATEVVKDAKQRVTAIAETDSDAIEKPVTVRPDGQEIVHTDSNVFTGDEKVPLIFPSNALPKTPKAELRIYPNFYSQISDSVEGLLHRPYGCGEQTISSTYPNLMILKFVKPDAAIAVRARKFLQKGYERLLGYQSESGGFTYWGGKTEPDLALTGYALRFLADASTQIDVDPEVIKKAEDWLLKQQRADGSWLSKHYWQTAEDPTTAKLTTTYVARTLAMLQTLQKPARSKGLDSINGTQVPPFQKPAQSKGLDSTDTSAAALTKALAYLKTRNAEIDEPYALALFGLASLDAGDAQTAASVTKSLESMAIAEGNAVYWKLETNTPFYGWGTAGRVETTALVTQLLIRINQKDPSAERQTLISKGTLFLLKNKDRYGVWYSTQTTINVLDAFIASIGSERTAEPQKIDVFLNGELFKAIDVAPDRFEAVTLDLAGKVGPSNNIEVRSTGNSPVMSQLVATHYVDWKDSDATNITVNQSRALSLDYKCDKTNAAIMQEVTCSVKAERIGFQGYGMLLAEIGTPPGADVSRESLESAIESDWSISHYEILPDRIVVYMWSKPGGTSFNFKFHPRYGINAQTPASVVYDYYNPEAQATVAPLRFQVK